MFPCVTSRVFVMVLNVCCMNCQESYATPGQKHAYPAADTMNEALAAFYGEDQSSMAKRPRLNWFCCSHLTAVTDCFLLLLAPVIWSIWQCLRCLLQLTLLPCKAWWTAGGLWEIPIKPVHQFRSVCVLITHKADILAFLLTGHLWANRSGSLGSRDWLPCTGRNRVRGLIY